MMSLIISFFSKIWVLDIVIHSSFNHLKLILSESAFLQTSHLVRCVRRRDKMFCAKRQTCMNNVFSMHV